MQQEENMREATEAILRASRAMVGLAARCLPESAEVTLPQWRALVLLDAEEQLNVNALAQLLGVDPSTCTRLCDRLVAKDLIERDLAPDSRREVCIRLSPAGASLVAEAADRRRAEVEKILAQLSPTQRRRLVQALGPFVEADRGVHQLAWSLGWAE
ncbi:MAG TPA: MarR family transcriptional regulator [Acidimicrobiales bacterium]|nr:MarR family transcriptional regulator [Acidimicrobiales bacterium]